MKKIFNKNKYTLANKLKREHLTFEECITMLDDWAAEEMTASAHFWLVGKLIEKVDSEKKIPKKYRRAIQIHAKITMDERMKNGL